jgi:hypothetical protein
LAILAQCFISADNIIRSEKFIAAGRAIKQSTLGICGMLAQPLEQPASSFSQLSGGFIYGPITWHPKESIACTRFLRTVRALT